MLFIIGGCWQSQRIQSTPTGTLESLDSLRPDVSPPAPGRRLSAGLWLLIIWLAALLVYLWHHEGLLEVPFIGPAARPGAFQEVLRNATGPYRIWWQNIPWAGLAWAGACLGLYMTLGWALLGCFEVYLPRAAAVALAFTLGAGMAGWVFSMIAMVHLLSRPVVLGTWIVMLAAAFVARARWGERPIPDTNADESHILHAARREIARMGENRTICEPVGPVERLLYFAMIAMIGVISALVFIHGVAYPETYWDSLILYMGYARKTFLEGGFPLKVVGQVGIGLGANYPHLYPSLSAQNAALAGFWSDSFAQLLPPLAGLASVVLCYYLALDLTRDRLAAAASALAMRTVPYGLAYNQFASDYAVAILLTAAFLYLASRYVRDGLPAYRNLMFLTAALAANVNYLMLVLWPVAALVVFAAHTAWPRPESLRVPDSSLPDDDGAPRPFELPSFMQRSAREPLAVLLRTRTFWAGVTAAIIIAAPWYTRNALLTGNPVYAFFYQIFPSRHVNPEVMESAVVEWRANGDGLASVGRTLSEKLANSWLYFVTGAQAYKLAPVFVGLVLPGLLIYLVAAILHRLRRSPGQHPSAEIRFTAAATGLFAILWLYAYVVADYYLYQIIIVLPLFAVFAAWVWRVAAPPALRTGRVALAVVVLAAGFAPGAVMAAMGFKLTTTGILWGQPFSQIHLTALRNPFMDRNTFYRLRFNGDMDMFARLTHLPRSSRILTHENRHLLLDERLTIIHLDDWEIQAAYRKPAAERLRILDEQEIDYYLYVPNEDRHPVNSLLGMDELIGGGWFEEIARFEASDKRSRPFHYRHIPLHMNVLYKRTDKDRPPRRSVPPPSGVRVTPATDSPPARLK
ncbi:MAG: glycosyltransferase family 39 protein [Candidatus Sumerlaeaceae bacterium]|nr:glycosyltransferase family 39 protein [Candidatus Sumerlaeaceae bacterium]